MAESSSITLHRGPSSLLLVAFPASWLALEVDDLDGNPRTAERPETLRQVLQRWPAIVAAVDGPMFGVADGVGYERSQSSRLDYRYLDRRHGVDVATRYPERGCTFSVAADGALSVMDGAREVEGARFALQGYPEILRGRVNEGSRTHDTNADKRAALCKLADGRAAFAISRSGIRAMGDVLLGLTEVVVTDAVYLDGGGSTALALRGTGGNLLVGEGLDARRVPSFVLAVPPASGSGPGQVGVGHARAVVGGSLVAVAVGTAISAIAGAVGAWVWKRRQARAAYEAGSE